MSKRRFPLRNCEFKQNKDVIFRQEDNEGILFNPQTSDIVVINSTGRFLWELFNNKLTKEGILTKLMDRYEVSRKQAEEDLDKFIADLKERDFIS